MLEPLAFKSLITPFFCQEFESINMENLYKSKEQGTHPWLKRP